MDINRDVLLAELENCKSVFNMAKLPTWDEMPKLELYMDQVVVLLNDYLGYVSKINPFEKSVTSSMINNYVKMKIIPAPRKKKYSRIHLSRLIVICSLKRSINISDICKMLPECDDEAENKRVYDAFVKSRSEAIDNNIVNIEHEFKCAVESCDVTEISNMISRSAVVADLNKMFAEKFTNLIYETDEKQSKKSDKDKAEKKAEKKDKNKKED
ncbi:MAG: DUF1836 domain-containing protein [Clostridia bacterium]|nr:DUF1836 domain-containing protein [Clostridia bacterium]